jgi:hypothetical protein
MADEPPQTVLYLQHTVRVDPDGSGTSPWVGPVMSSHDCGLPRPLPAAGGVAYGGAPGPNTGCLGASVAQEGPKTAVGNMCPHLLDLGVSSLLPSRERSIGWDLDAVHKGRTGVL